MAGGMYGLGPRGHLTEEEKANKPKVTKQLILRILSYMKPYWFQFLLVFVTIISIVINWAAAVGIFRHPKYKKLFLIVGIVVNLGLLGYYKYAGFLVSMINRAAGRDLFNLAASGRFPGRCP